MVVLLDRALGTELSRHLGYGKCRAVPRGSGRANSRNGHSTKTVLMEDGAMPLATLRGRDGCFEPVIESKGVMRLEGFDDKILRLYPRRLTVREIEPHVPEIFGVDVSPDLVSRVTEAVSAEVQARQSRPLSLATRWCSWTRCGSTSAMATGCGTRWSTSRWR